MERELEKDLKEIEYLIYVHKERENTHTQSVLERAHEIIETCAKAARTLPDLEELLSRENTPEITRSPRDNDVTEYCPHCDREITVPWNVERDELEKILEEMKESSIMVATSKEHYIHPQDGRFVEEVVLLNDVEEIIRKHMSGKGKDAHMNDGWIPVGERLPEEEVSVLAQWEKYDKYLNVKLIYLDVMWLDDAEKKVFETINGVPNGKVTAWRPLPEPYRPERSGSCDDGTVEYEAY